MIEYSRETRRIIRLLEMGNRYNTDRALLNVITSELLRWQGSARREEIKKGRDYYEGTQDILDKKRKAIGSGGQMITVGNLPNARIVDNQYRKMVEQKVNYLFGQPVTFETDNTDYQKKLLKVLNRKFQRTFRNMATDMYNSGISWLFAYVDDQGQLAFKHIPAYQVLPFWRDDERTELDLAVRLYQVEVYEGSRRNVVNKVEIYGLDGISYYVLQSGRLIPDVEMEDASYLNVNGEGYTWKKIPLIAFKRNPEELSLLRSVKSLQDAINQILSNFQDNMMEDARNTILVVVNYEGADLGQLRQNLSTYGAVKVGTRDGVTGDVKTLQVTVNAANYQAILETLKKALIENAMGYDAKDDRLGGAANQMNILSMYNDIDLDANGTETEFQAAFEDLLWFVNQYLALTGAGDFTAEDVKVVFNRDMLMNETEIMTTLLKAGLQLSQETMLNQVPYITDAKAEMKRVKTELKEGLEDAGEYGGGIANAKPRVLEETVPNAGTGEEPE